MIEVAGRIDQPGHLLLAQDDRPWLLGLPISRSLRRQTPLRSSTNLRGELPPFRNLSTTLVRRGVGSLQGPNPHSVEQRRQATLIAPERFNEYGQPGVSGEVFEKLDVVLGFAYHMSSCTVRGVAAVGKTFCVDDVDCADLVRSVVADASAIEVDGHAWSERPFVALQHYTARLGLVTGWMPRGVESDNSYDVSRRERGAGTYICGAGRKK